MKQRLEITGMHCVGCTMAVEGAIEDLHGVTSVKVNYARQDANVEYDDQQVSADDIIAAVESAGYQARVSSQ
jgi:copper chaperone CopZ